MPTKDIIIRTGKKHEHKRREYPAGSIIKGMDADAADWLIGLRVADEVTHERPAVASAPAVKADSKPVKSGK